MIAYFILANIFIPFLIISFPGFLVMLFLHYPYKEIPKDKVFNFRIFIFTLMFFFISLIYVGKQLEEESPETNKAVEKKEIPIIKENVEEINPENKIGLVDPTESKPSIINEEKKAEISSNNKNELIESLEPKSNQMKEEKSKEIRIINTTGLLDSIE